MFSSKLTKSVITVNNFATNMGLSNLFTELMGLADCSYDFAITSGVHSDTHSSYQNEPST
jgi:hypothetical protein